MTNPPDARTPAPPPEVSPRAAALARRFVSPIESFLHVQASSGLVLLGCAIVALALANSRWAHLYHAIVDAPVGLRLGGHTIQASAHFWINDGLMTVFFFVVGLEIRREIHEGELSNLRRAAIPFAAAIGGMVVPALVYLAFTAGAPEARRGWGVPMATDIAFAVGVLALLGPRVPPALRVLLLAIAIIDDIGSIVVIALFYSDDIAVGGFALAAAGIAVTITLQRVGARRPSLYVIPGVIVWYGTLRSGVHPTIAGVLIGLLTPASAWLGASGLVEVARETARRVEVRLAKGAATLEAEELAREATTLDRASREALAPAAWLQMSLHPWVAFVVMPVFALANAGVTLPNGGAHATAASWGIAAGLVLGKPVGIGLACFAATRFFRAALPRGIGWREIVVLGAVAGIGFTMALFIGDLAFDQGERLDEAKLAVLLASGVAIVASLAAGRLLLRPGKRPGAAVTPGQAEASDLA